MTAGPRQPSIDRFHHEKWLRSASNLLSRPDPGPAPFCVDGLIVEGSICVIQGRHKVGKTWVILDLILAMVGARPAFGQFHSPEPGRVMAVFEESGESALHRRLLALCAGYGIEDPIKALKPLWYSANQGVDLLDEEWQVDLLNGVIRIDAKVVVIDPLARVKGDADENLQRDMAPVLRFLGRLRNETGATVVFVHHTGHAGTHLRGSSDLEAFWESKLTITGEPTSGGPFTLTSAHRETEPGPTVTYHIAGSTEDRWVRLDAGRGSASSVARTDGICAFVDANPGCTAKEIAKGCHMRPVTVGAELRALEREGLVEMRPNGRRHEWLPIGVRP